MKFDAIIIGAGLSGMRSAAILAEKGLDCAVITAGLSLNPSILLPKNVTLLSSQRVCSGEIDGSRVISVQADRLPGERLFADIFVLATGKFASCGLVADKNSVYEPIFGLDVQSDSDRSRWFNADFYAEQPFLKIGLATDENGHPYKNGKVIENLYAVGEILAGISSVYGMDAIEESVSILCRNTI